MTASASPSGDPLPPGTPGDPGRWEYLPPGSAGGAPGAAGAGTWAPPGAPNGVNGANGAGPFGVPPTGPGRRPALAAGGRTTLQMLVLLGIVAAAGVALAVAGELSLTELIVFAVLIPSIILHEVAHGWVAFAFGDDTAKRAGRLSLNPLVHVDPIGTVILPAVLVLSGAGFFGWAKPVPVNLSRLRSPRNQGVLVSLAGPATNLVLAACFAVLFLVTEPAGGGLLPTWSSALLLAGLVNVYLAAFNLIPVPPLDGSALLERLLPRAWWPTYLRIRPYTLPALAAFMVINLTFHLGLLNSLYDSLANWWASLLGVHLAG